MIDYIKRFITTSKEGNKDKMTYLSILKKRKKILFNLAIGILILFFGYILKTKHNNIFNYPIGIGIIVVSLLLLFGWKIDNIFKLLYYLLILIVIFLLAVLAFFISLSFM